MKDEEEMAKNYTTQRLIMQRSAALCEEKIKVKIKDKRRMYKVTGPS